MSSISAVEKQCFNHLNTVAFDGKRVIGKENVAAWQFAMSPFTEFFPPDTSFEEIKSELDGIIREALKTKTSYDYVDMKSGHFGKVVLAWSAKFVARQGAELAAKKAVERGELCNSCKGETWVIIGEGAHRRARPCENCQSETYNRWHGKMKDNGSGWFREPAYTKNTIARQDELTGPQADAYGAPESSQRPTSKPVSNERAIEWANAILDPEYHPGQRPEDLITMKFNPEESQ